MLQDIRVRQRDYLIELARVLTQEMDLDVLLWKILRITLNLLNGEAGFIALYDPKEKWHVRAISGVLEPTARYIETYLKNFSEREESFDQNALIEINLLIQRICQMPELGFADGVGLPLVEHGNFLGIIVIFRKFHTGFTINDLAMLKIFADQAAIAIHNADLYGENIREKNRISALFDAVPDGIFVLDLSHHIVRVNPAMTKLLHVKEETLLGEHHDEVIVLENITAGMELSAGEAGGWPFSKESKLYVEGNLAYGPLKEKPLPVGIAYSPVMNDENTMINIIGLVRDISKFREADDLKNTFISTMSHELKTPVALIKGYASTMQLDDAKWDKDLIKESFAIIEEEADRLANMINSLLDASRLYAGALTLNRSEINIAELARNIAKRMQTQTDKHIIRCEFPADLPIIYGDADRIEQVLMNLISNAIKYSPGGEILISGELQNDFVKISVKDEGQGLQNEDLQHLFERFYRSKRSANLAKGVGLGLYLSNGIVEGHGGKMWAENRTDRSGAIFSFTLPLNPDDHPAALKFRDIGDYKNHSL